jgi:hypothetical protein
MNRFCTPQDILKSYAEDKENFVHIKLPKTPRKSDGGSVYFADVLVNIFGDYKPIIIKGRNLITCSTKSPEVRRGMKPQVAVRGFDQTDEHGTAFIEAMLLITSEFKKAVNALLEEESEIGDYGSKKIVTQVQTETSIKGKPKVDGKKPIPEKLDSPIIRFKMVFADEDHAHTKKSSDFKNKYTSIFNGKKPYIKGRIKNYKQIKCNSKNIHKYITFGSFSKSMIVDLSSVSASSYGISLASKINSIIIETADTDADAGGLFEEATEEDFANCKVYESSSDDEEECEEGKGGELDEMFNPEN